MRAKRPDTKGERAKRAGRASRAGERRFVAAAPALGAPGDARSVSFDLVETPTKLYSDQTRHWTDRENSLSAMARVDGQTFRLMGTQPAESASLPQSKVEVLPTRHDLHLPER